jgi:chemosensory pili system protein ChpA (sensor histidine kinase/response regulator)
VPVSNLYTRLTRTARDAAKAAGKQIELVLDGGETELDNGIIQQIADPLIHLVRNSVAHGIEASEQRVERGKVPAGKVAIRAYQRGNQIYIEVEDDGRGIDYEQIRTTAVTNGLIESSAATYLTQQELLEFLFRPGFSTAPKKTDLAGRGVGLDVVRANLAALNGEISIETEQGVGTRFILKVPLTLIITQALFLRCGSWVFAIPLAFVEEIRRIRASEIEEVGEKLLTRVRGQVMEVVRLDARLGLELMTPVNNFYRMVTVNVGNRQFGLIVEEVLRKDEIVIKGLGEYLHNIKVFPGATIAPDGSLILLLDVNRLVATDALETRVTAVAGTPHITPEHAATNTASQKTILLADDSISVRRFVGKMLEKGGYKVKLACDGFEALEIATQGGCDLVLTDLEMPRTNGYELMAHLHQNPATQNVPIIVLTSRAGPKHRDKALRNGASGFLSKPIQEEKLLATVAQFLGAPSLVEVQS